MKNRFLWLLLILFAGEFINCQITCDDGSVIVNEQCEECVTPKVVSYDKLGCVEHCQDKEFIESQGRFSLCVKECKYKLSSDGINCENYFQIKDATKYPPGLLNSFSECTGVISINGDECRVECPKFYLTIDKGQYRQCGKCKEDTHKNILIDPETVCVKKCKDNEIYDPNGQCIQDSACTGFVKLGSLVCEENCKGYFILGKKDKPYWECQRKCSQFQYHVQNLKYCYDNCPEKTITDNILNICLSQKEECGKIISADDKFCVLSCEENEYIIKIDKYKKCQSGCSDFQYEDYGEKHCAKQCPNYYIIDNQKKVCYRFYQECKGVISSDRKYCVESCEENEFNLFQNKIGFTVCQSSCMYYQYEQNGKKYCTEQCPDEMVTDSLLMKCHADISGCEVAASLDEKNCIKSCNVKNRETIVSKKCTVCKDYLVDEHHCKKICSKGQITDKWRKLCYNSKTDCPNFISSDGSQCLEKCNPQNKEILVISSEMSHPSQCEVCQGYFTYGKDESNSSCKPKCDDDQITIIPQKTCVKKLTDCKNYIISEDKRSCDSKCKYPQILKQDECITEKECSGQNEIIDETAVPIECKNKADQGYSCLLESSDGRRCLNWCLSGKQRDNLQPTHSFSSRKCEDCEPPEKIFITRQGNLEVGECKESISFQEAIGSFAVYLEDSSTVQDFEQVKVNMTDFISTLSLSKPSELSGILPMLKELAKEFLSTLLKDYLLPVKYNVHCVGSNNSAQVCLQLIAKGKSVNQYFDIESIMKEIPLDLTEVSNSNTDSRQNGVFLFFLKNNPLCAQKSCKSFPVVQVEIIDSRQKDNLGIEGLKVNAIFQMTQPLENYLCLHYDNKLTKIANHSTPVVVDKNSFSCNLDRFDGPISVQCNETYKPTDDGSKSTNMNKNNSRIIRPCCIVSVLIYAIVALLA